MRPLHLAGTCGLLLALAVAPALAQNAGKTVPSDPPAGNATAQSAPIRPLFSPIPTARAAEQCRLDCARTYYFCLAENEMQDCSPQWTQCRLACNAL